MKILLAMLAMALSPMSIAQQAPASGGGAGLEQSQSPQVPPEVKLIQSEYVSRIASSIRRFIVLPPNLQGDSEVEFEVLVLPDGDVLSVKLKQTSGNPKYDNAVERAIYRAAPLPLPPEPALYKYFRNLNLKFRAQ